MIAPLPAGAGVAVDTSTRQIDDRTLLGGSPMRVVRLSDLGRSAWRELRCGAVQSAAAGALGRRLTDSGLLHPRPDRARCALDLTVVVPVRDRAELLAQCLAALGTRHRVVVVDDGSSDPAAVAAVARRYDVQLVRRPCCGGPGAARNSGLDADTSELVAFLDSDCVPPADWIERLAGHFDDPMVAAVAPRVVPMPTSRGRYVADCGTLDLGPRESRVQANGRVSYIPTAAVVIRRSALVDVSRGGEVFDPKLRYGEDVDLIWRLDAAGWRVRYDPSVEVWHREAGQWSDRIGRRFRYGTSAAPLAERHPAAVAPMGVAPWPALCVAGLLARRPSVAMLGFAGTLVGSHRGLQRAGLPPQEAPAAAARAVGATWVGLGRYVTQFAAPLVVASMWSSGESAVRAWGRRAVVAALVAAPPAVTWQSRGPRRIAVGRHRLLAGHIADDIAYGAGVYTGCLQARSVAALRPVSASRLARDLATPRRPIEQVT